MTSLLDLLEGDGRGSDRIHGVATAIVTNNQDPEKLGRVKVRFPWLSESNESGWARVATPMAGHERGVFLLPEVGDEVLVAFEHGDVSFPYVVGALWNANGDSPNEPPAANEEGSNDIRLIKTRSGHVIRFDDAGGAEKIEIVDASEKNSIVLDTAAGTIAITADADITITSSSGKLRLEGVGVEIESLAGVTVHASTTLDLKGDGPTTLEGAVVRIN